MKNSISEQSFYVESEEEDDQHLERDENEEGNESDFSNYSNDNDNDNDDENNGQQSKPNSLSSAWPQSYRQSMDLYSNVPSPSLNFLGTPSLSRLGSSFLGSSLIRRHTPEVLPSLHKPLIPPAEEEKAPHRRSSHGLLPPLHPRKSSIKKFLDEKPSKDTHGLPISHQSSYGQAVVNGMNVLCGVGILSTPYAVKEGGWAGLSILFIFGMLSFYTGMLLRYCLDSQPGLETYPDIGQAAFGTMGRVVISASCVEYIILEGDNLSAIFPNAHLSLGGFELDARHLFVVISTLAVLPTVWLRDLSVLSYISEWNLLHRQVCSFIRKWVDDNVLNHISGKTHARSLWEHLESLYARKTKNNRMFLIKQMLGLKYHDGSLMTDHLNNFRGIMNQLFAMGIKFDEEIQGLHLLGSLPNSWETFRTLLSSSAPDGVIFMDFSKSSILNEEMRRKFQGSSSSDVLVTGARRKSKNRDS
ncbi:hypothetical protein CQW23_07251 [Capsicum baccatum]|uniref:Uncharacterized protein n=1 Tax=Capsicum baccatum TaxID=33114 RepID=A0A2G2X5U7_CAPBA|nr:hypothetical protein CQW23_07251 [Capsicum baccatum]